MSLPFQVSLSFVFLVFSLFSGVFSPPAFAAGVSPEPAETPVDLDEESSSSAQLQGKELRLAIKALDRSDPAVGFARGLQVEGGLFMAGGSAAMLGVILGGSMAGLRGEQAAAQGRLVVSLGMPLTIGVLMAGVPGMLTGHRYLAWYVNHRTPPSEIARLKLLNRWRRQYVQVRRDTGLVGSAFMGVATLLSGVGWAVADDKGFNGVPGSAGYQRSDGLMTLGFGLVTAGLAVTGLISQLQLVRDDVGGHSALAMTQLSFGGMPEFRTDGGVGYRVQGSLNFRF